MSRAQPHRTPASRRGQRLGRRVLLLAIQHTHACMRASPGRRRRESQQRRRRRRRHKGIGITVSLHTDMAARSLGHARVRTAKSPRDTHRAKLPRNVTTSRRNVPGRPAPAPSSRTGPGKRHLSGRYGGRHQIKLPISSRYRRFSSGADRTRERPTDLGAGRPSSGQPEPDTRALTRRGTEPIDRPRPAVAASPRRVRGR